jgi:hypothetical protein
MTRVLIGRGVWERKGGGDWRVGRARNAGTCTMAEVASVICGKSP